MHMKGNISVSPRRERQAFKGKITESKNKRLNIYFDSDDSSDESDCDNENKCLSGTSDDLHITLGKLNISSSHKSESEDDECKLKLVAKGLISEREQRREKRVQSTRPYPNSSSHIVLSSHQNGGEVVVERIPNYIQNEMVPNIPVPLVERSSFQPLNIPVQPNTVDDIDSILSSNNIVFAEEDFHKIFNALENQPGIIDHVESTQPKIADQIYEYAESESGYATSPTYSNLSPHSSVHSPNSLHSLQSPDPRGVPKYDIRLPAEYDTDHSEYSPQDNLCKDDYYKPSISKQIHTGRYMQDRVQTVSSITVDFPRLMSQSQMIPQRSMMPREVKNYKRITSPVERTKYLQPATETLVYESDLKKPAKERDLVKLNSRVVSNLWTIVANTSPEDFCSIKDDKTCLTKLLLMKELPKDFIMRIYTMTQRLTRTNINVLKHRDKNDRNALYIAALIHRKQPIVARFIADTYVHHDTQEYSPDESYANDNTLLHILAGENDEFAQVMAELLHTEMRNGTKSFKVNSTNKDTSTPLHIAAKKHSYSSSTLNISYLLIKHGANLTIRDKDGNTPLHIALKNHCDPIYVKYLLQSTSARQSINMVDNDNNTPLHLAAGRNDISFDKQKEVIMHLSSSNAQHDIHNREGKVALALVSAERKEDIRKILQRKT